MNSQAQQCLNTVEHMTPTTGQSMYLQCDRQTSAVTVVLELGPETLSRMDRLLALLEKSALPGQSQFQSLPQPVMLTYDNPQSEKPSPYLDAQQAAEYLGIKVKSLYGVVERGQLKPLRGPKRTYRFTKEILDEYLKSRR